MRNPQSTTSSQGQRYVISVEHRLAIPSSVCGEGFERKESRALSFRPRENRECELRSLSKSDVLYAELLLSNVVRCRTVTANTLDPCNKTKYRKTLGVHYRDPAKGSDSVRFVLRRELIERHRRLCRSERSRVDIRCAQAPGGGRNDGDG